MEDPLTLFIRVVSLKARGKGKPLGRVGGRKAVNCGGTEKKGRLRAPVDPEVRQRRYPCLRQGFHSIGSVKTARG